MRTLMCNLILIPPFSLSFIFLAGLGFASAWGNVSKYNIIISLGAAHFTRPTQSKYLNNLQPFWGIWINFFSRTFGDSF